MEKTKFCVWHSGGILCLEMTQHQLQLESWDNWGIVCENLIKNTREVQSSHSYANTLLCIEMTVCIPPRVLQESIMMSIKCS